MMRGRGWPAQHLVAVLALLALLPPAVGLGLLVGGALLEHLLLQGVFLLELLRARVAVTRRLGIVGGLRCCLVIEFFVSALQCARNVRH